MSSPLQFEGVQLPRRQVIASRCGWLVMAEPEGGYRGSYCGYTGDGGKYEPAGIVHKGEGVLSAAEIRAIGGEAGFNALRNSIMGKGHSSGGIVGSAATFAPFQAKLPANQINITVNVTEGGASVRQQGQSGMGESLAREIAQFVDRRIQEKNIQAQRQGGMAWQARNGGFS